MGKHRGNPGGLNAAKQTTGSQEMLRAVKIIWTREKNFVIGYQVFNLENSVTYRVGSAYVFRMCMCVFHTRIDDKR